MYYIIIFLLFWATFVIPKYYFGLSHFVHFYALPVANTTLIYSGNPEIKKESDNLANSKVICLPSRRRRAKTKWGKINE